MTVSKNSKTLVCIIGETRAQDLTWNKFKKNVLNSLNADLALCVAEKKQKNSPMYDHAKYIWSYKDSKDYTSHYNKAQISILRKKKLSLRPNWKKMIKIKDFWLARIKGASKISSGTGGLLIYCRWFLLQRIEQLKLNLKYDRFIITRSDFIWNINHPKMSNLDSNFIWIPYGESYGGYTDRHAVLSKNNYYDYLNLIEPILLEPEKLYLKMKNKNNWNLERYIKFYLEMKGYRKKVKQFPYLMYSVRNKKIKTRFRPGKYSQKHKYYVKYFKEYLSSMIMFFLIGEKNKDYKNFTLYYFLYRVFKKLFKFKLILLVFIRNKKISKIFDKEFLIFNLKKKFYF